jgi:Uma2 family endonuclease
MPDDGYRYELVRGELRRAMPAGNRHGRIAVRITVPLALFVRQHGLGEVLAAETGFQLATDHVRAPDVAFVRQDRVDAVGDSEGFWPGAPDLAIEVLSPSDRYSEVEEKVSDWLEAGTRMVVVVNPRSRSVTVFRSRSDVCVLVEPATLDGGDVVPGWNLPLAEVFG